MISEPTRRQKAEQVWRETHAHEPLLLQLALAWVAAEYAATEAHRRERPTSDLCQVATARANAANQAYLKAKHGVSSVFILLG